MNASQNEAWTRVLNKYSPSSSIKHSPVIMTQGKLCAVDNERHILRSVTFFINANEEYYYQNVIELLSMGRSNGSLTNQSLRRNRIEVYWPEMLTNFRLLGKGSFGVVYKVTDKITKNHYAVKEVKVDKDNTIGNIINIIVERNAHFRANESPFIVKLFGAFQFGKSFWMIFEHCMGDLSHYIETIQCKIATFMDMFMARNCMDTFNKAYSDTLKLDIENIAIIYAFELLAGLDYLATRNLVHRDFKPENVLVSSTSHLKIADLGLVQRLRWVDRLTTQVMVDPSDFKALENKDSVLRFAGNLAYNDPESLLFYKALGDPKQFYRTVRSQYFPIKNGGQSFLSDLYGISLIIMELLFVGLNFINTRSFSVNVTDRFDLNDQESMEFFPARCIYEEDVYDNYLYPILTKQVTARNKDLIDFLVSVFKPRQERAVEYTKNVTYFHLKTLVTSPCIDIEKIEALSIYQKMQITRYNVVSVEMPDIIKRIYDKKNSQITASKMSDLPVDMLDNEEELYSVPFYNFA